LPNGLVEHTPAVAEIGAKTDQANRHGRLEHGKKMAKNKEPVEEYLGNRFFHGSERRKHGGGRPSRDLRRRLSFPAVAPPMPSLIATGIAIEVPGKSSGIRSTRFTRTTNRSLRVNH